MSIFPTKILLATDGSSEAQSATQTAVDLGQKTDSELHVVHVLDIAPSNKLYPDAIDPEGVELPDPLLEEELELSFEQRGRAARRRSRTGTLRWWGSRTSASDAGRGSTGDRAPSRGCRCWSDNYGQPGARGNKEGIDGKCF